MEVHSALGTLWQLRVSSKHPQLAWGVCSDRQADTQTDRERPWQPYPNAEQADMGRLAGHKLQHSMHIYIQVS